MKENKLSIFVTKEKIKYSDLNAKQQEAYNFQKISALLADYGYITIKLDNDWNGADFIAIRDAQDGSSLISVQLKGRPCIAKKYANKDLCIAFPHHQQSDSWFIIEHDTLLKLIEEHLPNTINTKSWQKKGEYNWPTPSKALYQLLEEHRL
jgi:hypothetical protein